MVIHEFQGEYRFLSNFWRAPVTLDTVVFPTVEHAYQAAKFLVGQAGGITGKWGANGTPFTIRQLIHAAPTPRLAKKYGKMWPVRAGWDQMKLNVMHGLVRQKFQHQELADKLRATGAAELIEGNKWGDHFWGVCRGTGENHLGKILMSIRQEISNV